ncbi:hypothetical protein V8E36_008277 [Tilletia maclaganii]
MIGNAAQIGSGPPFTDSSSPPRQEQLLLRPRRPICLFCAAGQRVCFLVANRSSKSATGGGAGGAQDQPQQLSYPHSHSRTTYGVRTEGGFDADTLAAQYTHYQHHHQPYPPMQVQGGPKAMRSVWNLTSGTGRADDLDPALRLAFADFYGAEYFLLVQQQSDFERSAPGQRKESV